MRGILYFFESRLPTRENPEIGGGGGVVTVFVFFVRACLHEKLVAFLGSTKENRLNGIVQIINTSGGPNPNRLFLSFGVIP